MKRMKKSILLGLAATLAAAGIAGCGAGDSEKTITMGGKNFTEGFLMAELYSLALEDAGFKVERQYGISTLTLNTAIQEGEIDVYPEYTGTGLMTVLGLEAMTDAKEVYDTVKTQYKEKYDIAWLEPSQVNNSTCIVIRKETADQLGITCLSDLQKHASELVLADFQGWSEREDNLPAMNTLYGDFQFKDIISIDQGLKYDVLKSKDVDVIPGNTTEPQLLDDQYYLVTENIKVWPPYYLAPIVRQEVLSKHPEIEEAMNRVSAAMDNDKIVALVSQVDMDGKEYEVVAKEFYEANIK